MFKRLVVPSFLFLVVVGFFAWTQLSSYWAALSRMSQVMRLVHQESVYADRVDYEQLSTAAIKGMLGSLDQYSRYMEASEYAHYEEVTQQRYVGVGIQIEKLGGRVVVTAAFRGGAAAEVGVLPGDQIIRIDGVDARDWTVDAVLDGLKGMEGEKVHVAFSRPGVDEEREVTLIRRPVAIDSVTDVEVNEEGFGYLRLVQFGEKTGAEFREALSRLIAVGVRGLVLDLRDNRGGLLTAAREVAEVFFERGDLIVYTEGRNGRDYSALSAEGDPISLDCPIVVLINERSASASEIVAGAWQAGGKAYLIGERSYGKGSVQTVYSFRNGSGLRQTTALYYLASGRSINETGVVPDQWVEMDEEAEQRLRLQERHMDYLSAEAFEHYFGYKPDEKDLQLEAAWVYLREKTGAKSPERAF